MTGESPTNLWVCPRQGLTVVDSRVGLMSCRSLRLSHVCRVECCPKLEHEKFLVVFTRKLLGPPIGNNTMHQLFRPRAARLAESVSLPHEAQALAVVPRARLQVFNLG